METIRDTNILSPPNIKKIQEIRISGVEYSCDQKYININYPIQNRQPKSDYKILHSYKLAKQLKYKETTRTYQTHTHTHIYIYNLTYLRPNNINI